jgi:hypothetical protein
MKDLVNDIVDDMILLFGFTPKEAEPLRKLSALQLIIILNELRGIKEHEGLLHVNKYPKIREYILSLCRERNN